MSTPRTYTIRGLDLGAAATFNCQGLLSNLPGYVEITDVPTEAKAVELLLAGPVAKMVTGLPPVKSESYVDVINVKIDVNAQSTAEAKQLRKRLAESIKTWAEKSRVRGVRGWRAHALKTPKIQRVGSGYELDFDAILGHAVFYSHKAISVGHTDDASFLDDTIADLKKHVAREFPGLIGAVVARQEAKNIMVSA